MPFYTHGAVIPVNIKENYKEQFKAIFDIWLRETNYKTYKERFNTYLSNHSDTNKNPEYKNTEYFNERKLNQNSFVIHELKTLKSIFKWYDSFYNSFQIHKLNRGANFNLNKEQRELIKHLSKPLNDLYTTRTEVQNINDAFDNFKIEHYFFWIDYTYSDLRKVENFLNKKHKNIKNDTKDFESSLLKNEYPKIFKNDLAYTLFSIMFNHYEKLKNDNANFSFLYYAMEKEFLICENQIDFVRLLQTEKYDRNINKIDSRQWHLDMSKNKKSMLYNSEKDKLT